MVSGSCEGRVLLLLLGDGRPRGRCGGIAVRLRLVSIPTMSLRIVVCVPIRRRRLALLRRVVIPPHQFTLPRPHPLSVHLELILLSITEHSSIGSVRSRHSRILAFPLLSARARPRGAVHRRRSQGVKVEFARLRCLTLVLDRIGIRCNEHGRHDLFLMPLLLLGVMLRRR